MEIYGTIGPACQSTEILTRMFREGMTGIRLNASHSSLDEAKEWVEHIHKAAKAAGVVPQLLIDLQGPELRIGKLEEAMENRILSEKEQVFLGMKQEEEVIAVPEAVFSLLASKQEILLDDGKILLKAKEQKGAYWICEVLRGGRLQSRKSIALPQLTIDTPVLTDADRENLRKAGTYGVTGVMVPFVRGKKDLDCLRRVLKEMGQEQIAIYAKIENQAGIEALDEIIDGCNMVVIARGDLGNAMSLWELPAVQKRIAETCNAKQRKFMVVTQMLASMEQAKVPTRAEVSDIFHAVLDGADAVMLTGETATGKYPAEAMKYLVKTAREAENYILGLN